MKYYTTILDYFKNTLDVDDFNILTGYGLNYDDFKNGKSFEGQGTKENTLCISHEGYLPFDIGENSQHSRLSAVVSVYLKTNKAPETTINYITDRINNNNIFQTPEGVFVVELTGVTPITFERNQYIFQIDYQIT